MLNNNNSKDEDNDDGNNNNNIKHYISIASYSLPTSSIITNNLLQHSQLYATKIHDVLKLQIVHTNARHQQSNIKSSMLGEAAAQSRCQTLCSSKVN